MSNRAASYWTLASLSNSSAVGASNGARGHDIDKHVPIQNNSPTVSRDQLFNMQAPSAIAASFAISTIATASGAHASISTIRGTKDDATTKSSAPTSQPAVRLRTRAKFRLLVVIDDTNNSKRSGAGLNIQVPGSNLRGHNLRGQVLQNNIPRHPSGFSYAFTILLTVE